MSFVQELWPSESARRLLEEGRVAARSGEEEKAEELWRSARAAASAETSVDCGVMFLASVHLSFLYHSRGKSCEEKKVESVQEAMKAFDKAFHGSNFGTRGEESVPTKVAQILRSLKEIHPGCNNSVNEIEWRRRYTREELLEMGQQVEASADEMTQAMVANMGYEKVDIYVDIHPDNLLPPSRKQGGGKSSNAKKKKKKKMNSDNFIGDNTSGAFVTPQQSEILPYLDKSDAIENVTSTATTTEHGSDDNIHSSAAAEDVPRFTAEQALAWANSLENNVKSVLGDECILLVDETANADSSQTGNRTADRIVKDGVSMDDNSDVL